jgi:hypothetical protein
VAAPTDLLPSVRVAVALRHQLRQQAVDHAPAGRYLPGQVLPGRFLKPGPQPAQGADLPVQAFPARTRIRPGLRRHILATKRAREIPAMTSSRSRATPGGNFASSTACRR